MILQVARKAKQNHIPQARKPRDDTLPHIYPRFQDLCSLPLRWFLRFQEIHSLEHQYNDLFLVEVFLRNELSMPIAGCENLRVTSDGVLCKTDRRL